MNNGMMIDLHLHSTASDGTDTPEELLQLVRENGIGLFALTDHDTTAGCEKVRKALTASDPRLLSGIELSCRKGKEKYHILGYGFDPDSLPIRQVIEKGRRLRMQKVEIRLEGLQKDLGFTFPEEEVRRLLAMDTPGKPHIANLMIKYGYAESVKEAIDKYINRIHFQGEHIHPEEAIRGILESGGIPVLAHPSFGSGEELILGEKMDERLRYLTGFGLQGVEAFYSGFTPKLQAEILLFAEKYKLFVTAGSDYHGKNKLVAIGDTNLDRQQVLPDGVMRFLEACEKTPGLYTGKGNRYEA